MIYLDNAATSFKKPDEVIEAVVNALHTMGNSGRGAHGASLSASRIIYGTRELLSEMFNAGCGSNVAFTSNSTESLNIAIQGILKNGDHAITTALEHNSVLRPLYLMESTGCELSIIGADLKGNIDYKEIEASIKPNTKLIVCTHASNLTGNLVDISRIGEIAKRNDIFFVVDASQSAGVIDIDMQKMNIDVLCVTGHKSLLGIQGIGAICINKNSAVDISPLKVGGSGIHSYSQTHPEEMPTRLEAGTLNGHGIVSLNASLKYLKRVGIENIRNRELELMWRLYDGLKEIESVVIYGDFGEEPSIDADVLKIQRKTIVRAPIVTINIRDFDSSEVADELGQKYGIAVRSGAHCAPLLHKALGTVEQGAVRFSISHFNTEEEIDKAISSVSEIAE